MSERPHLLILTHEFRPVCGGIAVYAEELARAACREYEVGVWAPEHKILNNAQFPFTVSELPIKGTHNPGCVLKTMTEMRKLLFDRSPEVLCLAEPGPLLSAMFMQCYSELPGKAVVPILHGSEMQRFISNSCLRVLFKKLLKKAARIGTVSEYNRKKLLAVFPELTEKTCVVSGTLRHNFDDDISAFEKDTTKIVLLTVARIHQRKGQLAVIEAISQLPESLRQRLEYQVVGSVIDESYRDKLVRKAKDSGLDLTLVGEVTDHDLGKFYQSADIFALTSMPYRNSIEGYGIVYLEAGHYRLPSVAHRIGGVPEAVLDEETGLLTDPEDRAALSRSIQRLIEDAPLRELLGKNAYKHAHQRTWSDNVRELFGGLKS